MSRRLVVWFKLIIFASCSSALFPTIGQSNESSQQELKQAFLSIKQQQQEKSRNALNALAEQVQSDPCAWFWDSSNSIFCSPQCIHHRG